MRQSSIFIVAVLLLAISYLYQQNGSLRGFIVQLPAEGISSTAAALGKKVATKSSSVIRFNDSSSESNQHPGASYQNQSLAGRIAAPPPPSIATSNAGAGAADDFMAELETTSNATTFTAPTSTGWLSSILLVPMVNKTCSVEFVISDMSICYFGENIFDKIALKVVLCLLEHKFGCAVASLRIVDVETETAPSRCFYVRPLSASTVVNRTTNDLSWAHKDSIYLLPFLVPDFYAMPTMYLNAVPHYCRLGRVRLTKKHLKKTVTFIGFEKTGWRDLYETLKFCDYIGTSTREGLLIADSLRIPAVAVDVNISINHPMISNVDIRNKRNYGSRPAPFSPRQGRLNYTRAEPIAQSFPFELFTTRPEVHDSSLEKGNRTLVIIIGSLRGGEKAWQSLYKKMLDVNSADLALMVGETNSSKTASLYERATYVWEFPEYDDWADAIDTIDGPGWRTKLRFNKNIGVLGGALGSRGSGAIIFMARYWLIQRIEELKLQEKYDRFVVTRADFFYRCPQDLSQFDEKYVWVPSGRDWGGINDRQVIASSDLIVKVLNVLPPLIKNPVKYYQRILQTTPEGQIWLQWTIDGIYPDYVRRFPATMYTSFVDGDKSRWGSQSMGLELGETEDGVFPKYTPEYHFAKCFCEGGKVADQYTLQLNWTYSGAKQYFVCTSPTSNISHSSTGKM